MTEAEWKIFRRVREVALDRFCERALTEITKLSAQASKTNHERYLVVYKRLQRRDRELADAFDDVRRSTAERQLAKIFALNVLTDEELGEFEPVTQSTVRFLSGRE
jgi:hypothetical protein